MGGLATAAGGVATGLAAVIGTGMVAYGEEVADSTEGVETAMGGLSHELEPARAQLHETAMTLGSEFTPLIGDAIDALPAFIRRIERAIGPLSPFAAALRDAGQAAFDVIPRIVAQMMDMGRDALPAVRRFGSYLADNAVPIMEEMADTTDRIVELVPDLAGAATTAIPKINQFGLTVLEDVVPALEVAGSKVADVAGKFNNLSSAQQSTAAKASLVAPVLGSVATRLTGINPILGLVTAAVGSLGFAWTENIGNIRTKTNRLVQDMTKYESVRDALTSTADTAQSALGDASTALTTFVNENETTQASIGDLQESLSSASDGILQLSRGKWSSGFDSLTSAADSAFESIETTLVGSGGSGGLTAVADTAVSDAQNWLQSEGTTAVEEAFGAVVSASVDSVDTLSNILVGPNGSSGVLSETVDQADVFLSTTAPKLLGAAAEGVGNAIRGALVDFTNPLRGKNSEIWDMLADAATWLVSNSPQLFRAVGASIVNSIIEGVKGLFAGLVGNSVLKDEISDAGDWLVNNMGSVLGDVGGAIVDEVIDSITGIATGIKNKIRSGINTAIRSVNNFLPNSIGVPQIGPYGGNIIDTGPAGKVPGVPNEVRFPQIGPYGGGSVNIPGVPIDTLEGAETGGYIDTGGLLNVHAGERVVPAAQVDDRGPAPIEGTTIHIERIEASSRAEGRAAARGLRDELDAYDI
ncbi:hypothetical protein [Halovenus marina]|uniref:hypothetical protein n=1 Tax=Halovenus marina TaxID=3396621 RepID=UPI003F55D03D